MVGPCTMKSTSVFNSGLFQSGLALAAVGGIFWGAVQVKDDTTTMFPETPLRVFEYALILGYVMMTAGISLVSLSLYKAAKLGRLIGSMFREAGDRIYDPFLECSPSSRNELKVIHDIGERDFGSVSALPLMENLHAKNDQVFWVVRSSRPPAMTEIVGYFTILPLSAQATRMVENVQLSGLNISHEHITKSFNRAKGIYVGAVHASSLRPKAVALQRLQLELLKHGRKLPLYGRPVTGDGRRIMRKHGFVQIATCPDGFEMWRRDPTP